MKTIALFFSLIRWPNLLIVFFTQFLIWGCLFIPLGLTEILNINYFLLLSLSTILIASGGYIINDYFDVEIDKINKPNKTIIDVQIKKKTAILLYFLVNFIGMTLATMVTFKAGKPSLISIQLFCVALLLLYAAKLKGSLLVGNISIALLTALTILIIPAYEPNLFDYLHQPLSIKTEGRNIINPASVLIFFSFFSFFMTLIRELIKDLEDVEGDRKIGLKTLAIRSPHTAKKLSNTLVIGMIAILVFLIIILLQQHWVILSIYLAIGIILPLIFTFIKIQKAQTSNHYRQISKLIKLMMLSGLLILPLYFIMTFAL